MATAADGFKAWGLPIFLMCTLALAVALTHKQLRHAQSASALQRSLQGLFWSAVATSLMSVPLYFTAAWAYGLVSTIICYAIALLCSASSVQRYGKHLLGFQAVWFAMLIGLPSAIGHGIIADITTQCQGWYGSASGLMCASGWLTIAQLIAIIVIGLNFLALLTILASALTDGSAEGGYEEVKDGGDIAPPGYAGAPGGEYQKVA